MLLRMQMYFSTYYDIFTRKTDARQTDNLVRPEKW